MNGKRAGVAVSLITVLAFCVLSSGCRHTEGQYTELMARLDRGIEGKGLGTNTIATNAAAAQPEVHTVSLSRQIDRAWLQPPTNLFTLGPGDRLEIEIIGEPGSRTTTVVAPDGKIYFMNHRGDVFVVEAGEQFKLLHTTAMGDEGDHDLRSSIAIAQGCLFTRTGSKLYCVGQK